MDPARTVAVWPSTQNCISPASMPLKAVMRDAAASDLAARELIRRDHERPHSTHEGLVDLLIAHRALRAGIDRNHAIDTFFALVNSDTYDLLVTQRGWTMRQWQDWLIGLIEHEFFNDLFARGGQSDPPRPPPTPRADRSRPTPERNHAPQRH